MTLEEMNVVLRAETSDFNAQLDQTKQKIQSFSSTTQKASASSGAAMKIMGYTGVAALTLLAKKFVQFSATAIEAASDLEEVQNVVNVAFGNMSKKAEDFADSALEMYGMSEYTAKSVSSTFMAMAGSIGLASEEASDMALELAALSADMGSFYNRDISETSKALESIFTGTTESLRKYGIVLTETNLNEFLRQRGIDTTVQKLTEAEKVQLRYQYVMTATANAQGDFARTTSSWANQTKILNEQVTQLTTTIGSGFKNVLQPVLNELNNALGWIVERTNSLYKGFSLLAGWTDGSSGGAAIEGLAETYADYLSDAADSAAQIKHDLMGFDELNILSQGTATGTSSTNTSASGQSLSNTIKSGTETIAQAIEDSTSDRGSSGLGSLVKNRIGDALRENIKQDLVDVKDSVLKILGFKTEDIESYTDYKARTEAESTVHTTNAGSTASGHGSTFDVVEQSSVAVPLNAKKSELVESTLGSNVASSVRENMYKELDEYLKNKNVVIELDGEVISRSVSKNLSQYNRGGYMMAGSLM